ncbi:hypothetical protein PsAD37_03427 [Pseudovibrio sp. Ad37]|nr:hypothetical protein PsAD37_03427 [Pseudovibrio sp. Ad37]KZL25449.1 hypothetical protein PsWM33_01953 [Pseudovibrio sp. WM33]
MATRFTNSYLKIFKYEGKRIRLSDSVEEGLLVTVGAKKKPFRFTSKLQVSACMRRWGISQSSVLMKRVRKRAK